MEMFRILVLLSLLIEICDTLQCYSGNERMEWSKNCAGLTKETPETAKKLLSLAPSFFTDCFKFVCYTSARGLETKYGCNILEEGCTNAKTECHATGGAGNCYTCTTNLCNNARHIHASVLPLIIPLLLLFLCL